MTLHICWTELHQEIARSSVGERWCFVCRDRHPFDRVVMAPVEMSYYGPHSEITCTVCKTVDGDVFPGRERFEE